MNRNTKMDFMCLEVFRKLDVIERKMTNIEHKVNHLHTKALVNAHVVSNKRTILRPAKKA